MYVLNKLSQTGRVIYSKLRWMKMRRQREMILQVVDVEKLHYVIKIFRRKSVWWVGLTLFSRWEKFWSDSYIDLPLPALT